MADTTIKVRSTLKRRYNAERRFRLYGLVAILASVGFLAVLVANISINAVPAFTETRILLSIDLSADALGIEDLSSVKAQKAIEYESLLKQALQQRFPEVKNRKQKQKLKGLISQGAYYELRQHVLGKPKVLGSKLQYWTLADDDIDLYFKGLIEVKDGRITPEQANWIAELEQAGEIKREIAFNFFNNGDSREPELAGIYSALWGSIFTIAVTLALSFPVGVLAAIYLEEFAPKNRITSIIEVNINNLAAVPSIVFGLLGLAVFLNFFSLPRSAPLVGGLVLSLMTLPTIIIASRAAIKAVPPSIRSAALGLGASNVQVTFHHVLPLAMPGILTGTIIGVAQALGETAPLLMIGMVAFIADVPSTALDPSTVLPVQIYLWADSPERAFTYRTSAAILVLLGVLVSLNAIAVYLRKRFERRW